MDRLTHFLFASSLVAVVFLGTACPPVDEPTVQILAPTEGEMFLQGAEITFTAIVRNNRNVDLTWNSSLDGILAAGEDAMLVWPVSELTGTSTIRVSTLSVGKHEIAFNASVPLAGVGGTALVNIEIKADPFVAGRTWDDTDADGIRDLGEMPIANLEVTLVNSVTDFVEAQQVTNTLGMYSFESVAAGSYYILIKKPSGQTYTLQDVNSNSLDSTDSDVDSVSGRSAVFAFADAAVYIDAGFIVDPSGVPGEGMGEGAGEPLPVTVLIIRVSEDDSIIAGELFTFGALVRDTALNTIPTSDFTIVWTSNLEGEIGRGVIDLMRTLTTPGVHTITATITLNDPGTGPAVFSGTTTIEVFALPFIEGKVFFDSNRNGLFDIGVLVGGTAEPAEANIEVRLLLAGDLSQIQSARTGSSQGDYAFHDISPGSYRVEFVPRKGTTFTLKDVGTQESLDSDVDPSTGRTDIIVVGAERVSDVDAGLIGASPSARYQTRVPTDKDDFLFNIGLDSAGKLIVLNDAFNTTGDEESLTRTILSQLGVIEGSSIALLPSEQFLRGAAVASGDKTVAHGGKELPTTPGGKQTPTFDALIFLLDEGGNLLWENTVGGAINELGSDVIETADGGFLLTGITQTLDTFELNIFLARFDSLGSSVWFKSHDVPGNVSDPVRARELAGGGFLVASPTFSGVGGGSLFVLQVDADGDLIAGTDKLFPDVNASGLIIMDDSTFVVRGSRFNATTTLFEPFLARLDSDGGVLWDVTYAPIVEGATATLTTIAPTIDDGFIAAGFITMPGEVTTDFYLLRTDSMGVRQWEKTFGGAANDSAEAVTQAEDGGFFVAGETQSFGATTFDVFVVKTDADGNSGPAPADP